jgi:hypothetical protein
MPCGVLLSNVRARLIDSVKITMRNLVHSCLIIFAIYSIAPTVFGQVQKTSLRTVSFMAGCWEMKDRGRKTVINEQWMAPSGDGMLGMNRTLIQGRVSAFEFLRIIEKGGTLYYVALPSENSAPTSFELKSASRNSVVFENLANDFPKTITYRIVRPDAMTAVVENLASDGKKGKRIEFPMLRTKCG